MLRLIGPEASPGHPPCSEPPTSCPPPPASGVFNYGERVAEEGEVRGLGERACEDAISPERLRQFVTAYLPLVHRVVRRLARRLPANVQRDDLLAAGICGLVDSLQRNGGNQGAAFEGYARTRIRGAVFDELRAQDWLSRRARDRIASAEAEGSPAVPTSFISIEDMTVVEDCDFLCSEDDPLEVTSLRAQHQALIRAIEQLPERERRIVGRHYFEGAKLKELSVELGVSEPRISQLHARALTRLRALLLKAA